MKELYYIRPVSVEQAGKRGEVKAKVEGKAE
jgi:hypothetical protein